MIQMSDSKFFRNRSIEALAFWKFVLSKDEFIKSEEVWTESLRL